MLNFPEQSAPNFVYVDSSQQEEQQCHLEKQKLSHGHDKSKQSQQKIKNKRICCALDHIENHDLLPHDDARLLEQVLNQHYKGEQIHRMAINVQDKQLERNIMKRQANYQYFLQNLEIDKKYQEAQARKSLLLKQKNRQKKQIFKIHQSSQLSKDQHNLLLKYLIEKKQKEAIVLSKLKKEASKMQINKMIQDQKSIQQKIKAQRDKREKVMGNILNDQSIELESLRNQLNEIREEKRINKLEEQKAIRELEIKVKKEKQELLLKFHSKKDFVI